MPSHTTPQLFYCPFSETTNSVKALKRKVLHPTRHKMGHFGDVLPSQSLGLALKKLKLTLEKQTTQKQNRRSKNGKTQHAKPKPKPTLNLKNCLYVSAYHCAQPLYTTTKP